MTYIEQAAREYCGCPGIIQECDNCESKNDCRWLHSYEDFLAGYDFCAFEKVKNNGVKTNNHKTIRNEHL